MVLELGCGPGGRDVVLELGCGPRGIVGMWSWR